MSATNQRGSATGSISDSQQEQFASQVQALLEKRSAAFALLGEKIYEATSDAEEIRALALDSYEAVDAIERQLSNINAQISLMKAQQEEAERAKEEAEWEEAARAAAEEAERAAAAAEEQRKRLEEIRSERQKAVEKSHKASEDYEAIKTLLREHGEEAAELSQPVVAPAAVPSEDEVAEVAPLASVSAQQAPPAALSCPVCGAPVDSDHRFCMACGFQLSQA